MLVAAVFVAIAVLVTVTASVAIAMDGTEEVIYLAKTSGNLQGAAIKAGAGGETAANAGVKFHNKFL